MDPTTNDGSPDERESAEGAQEVLPEDQSDRTRPRETADRRVIGKEVTRGAEFWRRWRALPPG